MGYRYYFKIMSKAEYEKLKGISLEELLTYGEDCGEGLISVTPIDVLDRKDSFQFEPLENTFSKSKPFFMNPETQEYVDDSGFEMCIVPLDAMKDMISYMQDAVTEEFEALDKAIDHAKGNLGDLSDEVTGNLIHMIHTLAFYSKHAVNTDLDDPSLTNSGMLIHLMFELTRLYKSFNKNNDVLIIYAW